MKWHCSQTWEACRRVATGLSNLAGSAKFRNAMLRDMRHSPLNAPRDDTPDGKLAKVSRIWASSVQIRSMSVRMRAIPDRIWSKSTNFGQVWLTSASVLSIRPKSTDVGRSCRRLGRLGLDFDPTQLVAQFRPIPAWIRPNWGAFDQVSRNLEEFGVHSENVHGSRSETLVDQHPEFATLRTQL